MVKNKSMMEEKYISDEDVVWELLMLLWARYDNHNEKLLSEIEAFTKRLKQLQQKNKSIH